MLHLSIVYRQFKYISTREREAKRNKFWVLSQGFWGLGASNGEDQGDLLSCGSVHINSVLFN